ncbi:CsbD family protein [Massilia sp. GCM10020059]|uniref:CsbD family protein n=1 Tax=Massilia agrisoli TaxID=2892444 RepID=A0ABS8IQJ1_9BURK|nr:CsbD family protein [Massilia agrisoli]MCC6070113.1 CsbD family protein [Massilia agrisoli]
MNKDQVKGKAKEVAGKIQKNVGDAVGSSEQQLKGMKNQAEGNIQQKAGDVKEAVKDRGNR